MYRIIPQTKLENDDDTQVYCNNVFMLLHDLPMPAGDDAINDFLSTPPGAHLSFMMNQMISSLLLLCVISVVVGLFNAICRGAPIVRACHSPSQLFGLLDGLLAIAGVYVQYV